MDGPWIRLATTRARVRKSAAGPKLGGKRLAALGRGAQQAVNDRISSLGTTLATRAFLAWVLATAVVDDSPWLFPLTSFVSSASSRSAMRSSPGERSKCCSYSSMSSALGVALKVAACPSS